MDGARHDGSFVYRFEDRALSRRRGGFDSRTGYWEPERSEAWLSRLVGGQEIGGSNPPVLTDHNGM